MRVVRSGEIALITRASDHDFLFIDTQHAVFNRESVAALIISARGAGVSPLVRVRSHADPDAALFLDVGAGGLIVPDVNTAEDARSLVRWCRFPPRGQRSLPGPLVQDDFRPTAPIDAMRRADAETVLVAMIETTVGVANAEEIAAVDGIDVLHVGCVDLLLALGRPGEQGCTEILEAIEKVARAAGREWTETFGSERLTGALLDRMNHHVTILEMNGDSYPFNVRLFHSHPSTGLPAHREG